MLVLTRKPGQALLIGDSIEIYVSEIRGDVVRLSIKAPREVTIMRREVMDAVRQENNAAATSDPALLDILATVAPAGEGGEATFTLKIEETAASEN